jgi:hypothetical protein
LRQPLEHRELDVAPIRSFKTLEKLEGGNEDQTVGIRILARSIDEPLRQIVENAGEEAAVVLCAVKAGKSAYGYNAGTGDYGDMLEGGILDPEKVRHLALQYAASVAGLLLTTEVMLAEAWHGRDGYVRALDASNSSGVQLSIRRSIRSGDKSPGFFIPRWLRSARLAMDNVIDAAPQSVQMYFRPESHC